MVNREDLFSGGVGDRAHALEHAIPPALEVRRLTRGELAAVVRALDPCGLPDLDAPLFGVDAMLRDDHRAAGLVFGARREQAREAGRDGVVDPRRRDRLAEQPEDRRQRADPSPEEGLERLLLGFALVHAQQVAIRTDERGARRNAKKKKRIAIFTSDQLTGIKSHLSASSGQDGNRP